MTIKLLTSFFAAISMLTACAQRGPLNGSGKIIEKSFNLVNFDKVELIDLAGKVAIEAGKPFSVSVAIDDNLADLLEATVHDGTLQLVLSGNRSNRLYIEKTNIVVRVSMPHIVYVQQRGNNSLLVDGIKGAYFKLKNQENGNTRLKGTVDKLQLTCNGNGNVSAEEVCCNSIKIHKSGNGDVYINTDAVFVAIGSGNGNVVNKGKGKADSNSGIIGNGEIKYTYSGDSAERQSPSGKAKRVYVTISNFTNSRVSLSVKYPVQGSYGIGLSPGEAIIELLPTGARLYRGSQFTLFKKPLYTVSEEATAQTLSIR